MTRIFGFERQTVENAHIPNGAQVVLDNLQEALVGTYKRGWQAYGMGFIVVEKSGVRAFSIFKGYQGLKEKDMIRENLPPDLHLCLANNPKAVFGVLQNMPDAGETDFSSHLGWEFPLESENWYAVSMGYWLNDNFNDEKLPWYNKDRPSLLILQYLEIKPETINFDWVDPRRVPYIVAVRKDGQKIFVIDRYSDFNEDGFSYVKEESEGMIYYQGKRNNDGEQA